jgi:hypothetical protein
VAIIATPASREEVASFHDQVQLALLCVGNAVLPALLSCSRLIKRGGVRLRR